MSFMNFTSSLSIVAILIALISNRLTVNGWSVATAAMQSSPWPFLLRTDASRSLGVQRSINVMAQLALVGTLLTTLTGVITPLGLQDIEVSRAPSSQNLNYIADAGTMGLATTPRSKYVEGRLCSNWPSAACPGSPLTVNNGSSSVVTTIPANVTAKFSSPNAEGPQNIQYRQYSTQIQGGVNSDQPSPIGSLTRLQSFIPSNSIVAAEGVIVDMTDTPGVGIIQHTFPSDNEGSSWTRDILWLEPVSECVDTNLTVQYKISDYDLKTPITNSTVVVDKGGLASLTTSQPSPYNDTSDFIDLAYHAYTGAVWGNLALLRALNTTRNNSHIGISYPLTPTANNNFGYMSFMPIDYMAQMASGNLSSPTYAPPAYVESYCRGYDPTSTFNQSTRMIHCSLLFGPPHKSDGSNSNILLPNQTMEQSVYSCASTVRATIQRVNITMTQQVTQNSGYAGLQISRQPTNATMIWAIEATGQNVSNVNAYWGPVTSDYLNDAKLYTEQSEAFYLPAGRSDYAFSFFGIVNFDPDDVQGCAIPGRMFTLMENLWLTGLGAMEQKFDFSGANDYNMFQMWQKLSTSASTASQIIKYVWSDLMANNAVGVGAITTAMVSPKGTSVGYDIRYAIPAFITLAFWAPFVCFSIFLLSRKRVTLHELRNSINQTSVGRAVTNMINPTSDSLARTKDWVKADGKAKIGLVVGQSNTGSATCKFDHNPVDQPLHQVLKSFGPTQPSQMRSRKASSFIPLEESNDNKYDDL
ncbi:hypothetical protein Unana1_03674 [Umbelopsis nana]